MCVKGGTGRSVNVAFMTVCACVWCVLVEGVSCCSSLGRLQTREFAVHVMRGAVAWHVPLRFRQWKCCVKGAL